MRPEQASARATPGASETIARQPYSQFVSFIAQVSSVVGLLGWPSVKQQRTIACAAGNPAPIRVCRAPIRLGDWRRVRFVLRRRNAACDFLEVLLTRRLPEPGRLTAVAPQQGCGAPSDWRVNSV